MTDTPIRTVGDLVDAVAHYDRATPIRIAVDGAELMDHTIGCVASTPGDPASDCVLPNGAPVVRITTGDTYCCLPDSAADALGWL